MDLKSKNPKGFKSVVDSNFGNYSFLDLSAPLRLCSIFTGAGGSGITAGSARENRQTGAQEFCGIQTGYRGQGVYFPLYRQQINPAGYRKNKKEFLQFAEIRIKNGQLTNRQEGKTAQTLKHYWRSVSRAF